MTLQKLSDKLQYLCRQGYSMDEINVEVRRDTNIFGVPRIYTREIIQVGIDKCTGNPVVTLSEEVECLKGRM